MTEKYVQTLDRSLNVLEILAQAEESLGVTEIGNRINYIRALPIRFYIPYDTVNAT